MAKPLLTIKNVHVRFPGSAPGAAGVHAVRGASLNLGAGGSLALVGESGSGKSALALSIMQLLPPSATTTGHIRFNGADVLNTESGAHTHMPAKALRGLRGAGVAYVFQEPSAALNPTLTIGYQIKEALKLHGMHGPGKPNNRHHKKQFVKRELETLLNEVGLAESPETARRMVRAYPHELSGGMQQRAMLAMALAGNPKLLVADEPTTALDVTLQLQILQLLKKLQQTRGMALLLITHNLHIVESLCQQTAVMLRGEIVEHGPTTQILNQPQHAYTQGLLNCIPKLGSQLKRLPTFDSAAL